jgi:hypothetical protein
MDYIERYLRHFPREQIMVILFEQIRASAQPLASVFEFLGVDAAFIPHGVGRAVNANPDSPAASSQAIGLSQELQRYLQSYYQASNARLADFLKQDLTQWW